MTNEQLLDQIRQGNSPQEATGKLYEQNRGMIRLTAYSIAGKFTDSKSQQIDLQMELEQEAFFGLIEAIEKWDPGQNVMFITYAMYWIKRAMIRYCQESLSPVRLPLYRLEHLRKYRAITERYEKLEARRPTVREYCQEMGIEPDTLDAIREAAGALYVDSLDRPIKGEDGPAGTFGDIVPAPMDAYGEIIDALQREELAATLWAMVDSLPKEQARIIRDIYQKRMTIEQAGKASGMTKSRAAKCKDDALLTLRKGKNRERLEAFYDQERYSLGLRGSVQGWRMDHFSSTETAAFKMIRIMRKESVKV